MATFQQDLETTFSDLTHQKEIHEKNWGFTQKTGILVFTVKMPPILLKYRNDIS